MIKGGNFMSNIIAIENYDLGEQVVKKSNDLVRAYYNMSLNELRIINTAISFIKDEDCRIVDIPVPAYKKLLNVSTINYTYVKSVLAKLRENTITLAKVDKNTGEAYDVLITGWVNRIQLNDGYISVEFNADVWGHLVNQKNKFTKYQLVSALNLTSKSAYRLYEILKSYDWTGTYQAKVSELRSQLFLEDKYKKYNDLVRNIIDPAVNEINSLENGEIQVSYTGIKNGRRVDYIVFNIKKVNKHTEQDSYPPEVLLARSMSEVELFTSIKTLLVAKYKILFTPDDSAWNDCKQYSKYALESTYLSLLADEWKDHVISNHKAFFAEHLKRLSM